MRALLAGLALYALAYTMHPDDDLARWSAFWMLALGVLLMRWVMP